MENGRILCGTGDVIAQTVIEKTEKFDVVRTGRLFSIGCFAFGPILYNWYRFLAVTIKGTAKMRAVKMVLTDQTLMAPTIIALFLSANLLLAGEGMEAVKAKFESEYVNVLIRGYTLWPAVQAINFYFVPLHHRILVVNSVALFWNTYMSWVGNKEEQQ